MKTVHAHVWPTVLAGAMLAMAACGSSTNLAASHDLITPDQAKDAAMKTLQQLTTSAFVKVEAGSLRAISQANLTLNPPPSPEPTLDAGISHSLAVWVAHQSRYPLTFVAFDTPTVSQGQALPELFRFDKASRTAPWTITYQVILAGMSTAPDVALDGNGYAQVIPTNRYGSLLVAPAQLANDYAAYRSAANSADTHEFAAGPVTSQGIDSDNKLIRESQQKKGETVTVHYAPTGDPLAAYLLNDGGALVLFGVRATAHVVAGKAPITVTQDGKGIRGPAPGKYRDTTTETVLLLAFIDPPKGSADKVTGLGVYGGAIRSAGTRA